MTSEQTVAELGRILNDALIRIEALTKRLDEHFVTKEVFDSYKRFADEVHKNQRDDIDGLLSDKQWLMRLVGGVIVVALLGVIIASNVGGR